MIAAFFSKSNTPQFLEELCKEYEIKLIKITEHFKKNYILIEPDLVFSEIKSSKKMDFNYIKKNHTNELTLIFKEKESLDIALLNTILRMINSDKDLKTLVTSHPITNSIIFGRIKKNDEKYLFIPENRTLFATIPEKTILKKCIISETPNILEFEIVENSDQCVLKKVS